MTKLLSLLAIAALWWPTAAAARPRAHLAMNQARVAIARFDGPTATTKHCWIVRRTVTVCDFSIPTEGWTYDYHAVARLHPNGHITVEWPGWESLK